MPDGARGRRLRRASETVDDVVAWRLSARLVAVLVVTALVGGALPHALGAVGADPVDTGDRSYQDPVEDPRQRHQNAMASNAIHMGPWVLLFVALAGSFVAATRSREPRRRTAASAALGVGAGTAVGYVALVAVGHLAYAPTANGYLVQSTPVVFRAWATVGNAVGIAVPATVGSALVAASGTLPARNDAAPENTDGEAGGRDNDAETTDDTEDSTAGERPDSVAADATGPSGAPAYDPAERDWEGADGED
ncbi:hypothetical protein [Halorubellus sp. PRR65]|uniref:hypothetical protein n=1 Tax=Halorubellus sp. PRR65 TaxID=3098148 RepID=UPI002B261089|nr:hypothetical protein [Halorubellus sp. PRR65]